MAGGQKRIFVHCGLHKTGTTALQNVFLKHEDQLRARGLLYPRAGRLDSLGGGHHAIAWQLSQDRRYQPGLGTMAQLLEELAGFDGDAVISSEDFESILDSSVLLQELAMALAPSGREIVLVVYLREQVSYCQSLFIENICQNVGTDFPSYVYELTKHGRLRLRDWVFQFDYMRLMTCLEAAPVRLILRNFHALSGGSVITDFLNLAGLNPDALGQDFDKRSNQMPRPAQWLTPFMSARLQRPLGEYENAALTILKGLIGVRRFVSTPETSKAFANVFGMGNILLCTRHGLPLTGLGMAAQESPWEPEAYVTYEQIFSFRTQCLMFEMRNALRTGNKAAAATMARDYILGEHDAAWAAENEGA